MSCCSLNITRARAETEVSRHSGKAAAAAATAASISASVLSGTCESTSCVACVYATPPAVRTALDTARSERPLDNVTSHMCACVCAHAAGCVRQVAGDAVRLQRQEGSCQAVVHRRGAKPQGEPQGEPRGRVRHAHAVYAAYRVEHVDEGAGARLRELSIDEVWNFATVAVHRLPADSSRLRVGAAARERLP
eukprot:COSAG01_NODE_8232_length_2862_cov_15.949330_1_plen_192_part_00